MKACINRQYCPFGILEELAVTNKSSILCMQFLTFVWQGQAGGTGHFPSFSSAPYLKALPFPCRKATLKKKPKKEFLTGTVLYARGTAVTLASPQCWLRVVPRDLAYHHHDTAPHKSRIVFEGAGFRMLQFYPHRVPRLHLVVVS